MILGHDFHDPAYLFPSYGKEIHLSCEPCKIYASNKRFFVNETTLKYF